MKFIFLTNYQTYWLLYQTKICITHIVSQESYQSLPP